MNKIEAIIEDHKEMLAVRKFSIRRYWKSRHKDPSHMRWLIEQAKMHKHMIEQVSELNTANNVRNFCGGW